MDADRLFREGMLAVREGKDLDGARKLLLQSLKLNPKNENAWLLLSQTVTDPQKKLECVNRALRINPNSERAQKLHRRISTALNGQAPAAMPEPAAPDASGLHSAPTIQQPLTPREANQVRALLDQAEARLKEDDAEGAVELWLRVLEIRVDHEIAIQNAVRYLARLNFMDEAQMVITRALDAGSTLPSVYLTAIDIARRRNEHEDVPALATTYTDLPTADDTVILKMVEETLKMSEPDNAFKLLEHAIEVKPKSQKLLLRMAELQDERGNKRDAMGYYEQAARLKSGTKEGKRADKMLNTFTPVISDRERGSTGLALRETVGIGAVFLLMGWQDAGLNLLLMGANRWLGVLVSLIGGYLVVSAVSSPQQQPLAKWLGGRVPPSKPQKPVVDRYGAPVQVIGAIEEPTALPILPGALRFLFLLAGVLLLIGAFVLVFNTSLALIREPVMPYIPDIEEFITEGLR